VAVTRWFTADLHLGHERIINLSGRPFGSADEMNEALIDRWNAVVAADDEVWVLGDFALGPIDDSLALGRRLAGRKHLILGNHDRPFMALHRKPRLLAGWLDRYRDEAGFDEIATGGYLTLGEGAGAVDARMSHFPYRGDSGDVDRFVDARPADDGGWLLHGHVHEQWATRDRMINVGVDVWGYRPVHEDAVLDIIRAAR
jgi:calcineurin-like phosphoesterase family protein